MRFREVDSQHKIDIVSFLRNYAGISGNSIKQNRITHDDLLILFPELNLVRVPYDVVYKNPELVYTGECLIVYDANNELIVYKNPARMEEILPEEEYNYDLERNDIDLPNLHDLSKEELLKLRRKARLNGDHRTANLLTNYIRMAKRREPKKYKRDKEDLRIKDMEEGYEKIKRR